MLLHRIILCASFSLVLSWFLPKNLSAVVCPRESSFTEGNRTKITALVLARGGSKGIPLKNLAKVNGVSLLGRALRIIRNSNAFDELWVSTDHRRIADEATLFGSNVHWRHESTARDESTSLEAVQEFLRGHPHVRNIALIQCTSVFVREKYLTKAAELFRASEDVDCVFAVTRSWKLRWQYVNETHLKAVNFDAKKRPRRQDWPGELIETGMFYFARRDLIEQQNLFQNDRCRYVEIDAQDSLEIDDLRQLELANVLVRIEEQKSNATGVILNEND